MSDSINFKDLTSTTSGTNSEGLLGKMVYYSLSDALINRAEFERIRSACNIGGRAGTRISASNAFRAATGDIRGSIKDGANNYKVYFRDNRPGKHMISRELVLEELGKQTNVYTKLANVVFEKRNETIRLEDMYTGTLVSVDSYFQQVQELYEKYRRCVNRRQIETVATNMLAAMDAIKIQTHGHMYFVPRSKMAQVNLFEDFIAALDMHTQNEGSLVVNSLYVVNDEKQREKMAADFYATVRKDIELYEASIRHLIEAGCQSPSIMQRWVVKIKKLGEMRKMYEHLFERQLNEVNSEFSTLQGLSQELQIRINTSALRPCA